MIEHASNGVRDSAIVIYLGMNAMAGSIVRAFTMAIVRHTRAHEASRLGDIVRLHFPS